MANLNFGETSILYLRQFSWVFMANWALAVLITVFLIFFASRFVGFVLSQIVKWALWHKFRVYFEVGSLKFSLFGGNILFKNVVYIGENEAISILSGSINWRFWLKRARRNRLEAPEENTALPSRLHLKLKGVEWFVYNQSAAYEFDTEVLSTPTSSTTMLDSRESFSRFEQTLFKIMPATVEVDRFATIMGNTSTPTLLVAYSPWSTIEVDVAAPTIACDRYKMNYLLKFSKPKMYFVPNRDYNPKSRQTEQQQRQQPISNMKELLQKHQQRRKKRSLPRSDAKFPVDTPEDHAQVSKLLSADHMQVEYYYDVTDVCVKEQPEPQMGYNILVSNANINYGPWAERRRAEFFDLFFPQRCSNHSEQHQESGKFRVIPQLGCQIQFEGPLTLRIPLQEFSKVEERSLSKNIGEAANPEVADYGWLELISQDASINLLMDVVGRRHGFRLNADLDFRNTNLRTSVNHAELLKADRLHIVLTHQSHLVWNQQQTYTIVTDIASPQLFLLREHVNILLDLAADFNSGPPVAYDRFVPAVYQISTNLTNFELLLNVNPQNIISNPTSLDDNCFLIFKADLVKQQVSVPIVSLAPVVSSVVVVTSTECFTLDVSTPSWHTLDAFLDEKTVGKAHNFVLTNTITWYPELDRSKVESNVLEIDATDLVLVCHGFVIDHLMTLIDNYGGIDYQFQTFEEFLAKEHKQPEYNLTRNDIDSDIRVHSCVTRAAFVMPRYLYSARDNLCLRADNWEADLRFTNYYMDLQTEFSPCHGYNNYGCTDVFALDLSDPIMHTPELVVQAHRMFGLPPSEPTYICKWDFSIGDLELNVEPQFFVLMAGVGTAFGHGFADKENKPKFELYLPSDLTLVKAKIASINGQLLVGDEKVNLQTSAITFKFNDLMNERWDEKLWVDVPSIFVSSGKSHLSTCVRLSVFVQKPEQDQARDKQQDHIALHDSQLHRTSFLLDAKHRGDPNYCADPILKPAMEIPALPPQLTRETLLVVDPDMGDLSYHIIRDELDSETSLYGSGEHESSSSSDDSDGSTIFKKRWGEHKAPKSKYLEPWGLPENPEKQVESTPDVASNAHIIPPPRASKETTSLVVDVGQVNAHVDIELMSLFTHTVEHTFEEAIDDLQADIVKAIGDSTDSFLKFLIQCPGIKASLCCGETLFTEFASLQAIGELGPDVAMRATIERVQASLGTLRVDLLNPLLLWSQALELRVNNVDFGVAQFDALESFCKQFKVPDISDTRVSSASLIYSLLSSGATTEHDSYVLSRSPAGQSKNIVRGDISWRLVVRMRHLLAHMPNLQLTEPPPDAKDQILAILSRWRSWERVEPLDAAKIFKVFDKRADSPLPPIVLTIESCGLALKYSDTKEDYFVLDQLEVRTSLNPEQALVLVCTAKRARLGLSWEVLKLVERLQASLNARSSQTSPTSPEGSTPSNTSESASKPKVMVLLNVRDWSAELQSPTLRCEFQNRAVQLVCNVHDSFASGSFGSSQSAIRIHAGKLEILDYLMEKLSVGFSLNPQNANNLLWLVVKVDTLKLALSANFEEMNAVAQQLLTTEVKDAEALLQGVFPQDLKQSQGLQAEPRKSQQPAVLLHCTLSIASFVFQLKATDDLGFTFYGTNYTSWIRQPEPDSFLVNIEWDKYELRAKTAVGVVGSYHVEGTRILARADLDRKAFEVNYLVAKVVLETTSVLTLLQYAQSARTQEDLQRVKKAFKETFELAGTGKSVQPSRSSSSSLFNMSGHISQVRISVPLDDFSVELVFDDIDVSHRQFKWLLEGLEPEKTLIYGSFSELSSVLVLPHTSQKVFSIQLLASYKKTDVSSVYLTSDFCRVLLGPNSLRSIFAAIEKVKSNLPPPSPRSASPGSKVDFLDLMRNMRAAIAFRDLSVSWETDTTGIRAGFELLQINLLHQQCRMDLVGFNVTPSDSPWLSLEKNKYKNFAFLPHVEIVGVVLKDRFIDLVINGENLYVNLRPSIGLLLAAIIASVDEIQDLPRPELPSSPTKGVNLNLDTMESLFSHSIRLRSKFDSAIFKLWDDNIEALEKVPSLELSSPNISFDTEYQQREGRDLMSVCINVSSSRNKIFPRALQELDSLIANFSSHKAQQREHVPTGGPSFGEIKGEVVSKFLASVEVVVDLNLASQELSASSQPFSKVATTISSESVRVMLTTPIEEGSIYIACSGTLKGARLLLQHAHSHDRTGFGEIDELVFTLSHNVNNDFYNHPIRAAANVNKFEFEVKAPQMGDIKLFVDIWSPRKSQQPLPTPVAEQSIGIKYKRLLDAYPMSWSVNLVLSTVVCRADLGSSLGQVEVEMQRFWTNLHRSSSFQSICTGIDSASIITAGRFAGNAKILNASKRVSVYWQDSSKVPLVQSVFGISHLEASLGLDGHQFIALSGSEIKFSLSNQLTKLDASKHKLSAFIHLGGVSVALTSLVASNMFDVAESLNFIRTQSAIYEKTMLPNEAAENKIVGSILSRLSVHIYAQIDGIHLFVFPTSFEDTSALRVRSDKIGIVLSQAAEQNTQSVLRISSSMLKVGLYTFKSNDGTRPIFEHLQRISSSNILFHIPQTQILMETTDYGSRVEYIFKSLFGGDLEVGWNLGTVNFIKEMYETHKRTWLSRVATKAPSLQVTEPEDLPQLEQRPDYVPLQPPEIQIPNLHDMGVATPPVEWMGFNRERLPGMTHWFVIRALNEMVADIEKMYGRFLY